jgi:hypothetical protein
VKNNQKLTSKPLNKVIKLSKKAPHLKKIFWQDVGREGEGKRWAVFSKLF